MTYRPSPALLTTVLGLVALTTLVAADPVLAATSDTARNVGEEVNAWARALMLGTAALVGLPALAKRDAAQAATIGFISIIIGGFVLAPEAVTGVIEGVWDSVSGR